MMNLKEFLELCRKIARTLGKRDDPRAWSCLPEYFESAMVYEDDKVSIMADRSLPSLEVEMRSPHHNPVICIDNDGVMYRHHGERCMIEEHIQILAEGLQNG